MREYFFYCFIINTIFRRFMLESLGVICSRLFFIGATATILLFSLCLMPLQTWAACSTSGTKVTCTGSDLGPISYTEADAVDEIVVEDLTGDVSGSDGTAISLTEAGAGGSDDGDDGSSSFPATVTFDGTNGSDTWGVTDATDTSIIVTTVGGAGYSGESKSGRHETAGDGGDGGAGSAASITMTGGFVSQTEGETGIAILTIGGAGGTGGEAKYDGDSFDDSDVYGGDGGTGGAGDTATLTISDLSDPNSSYGIDLFL
ncbi:hypothetical protein K1W69_05870 [Hoeflea sp. WL0058]|uniref:Uncharacterized protein n=1 Tax=Flavimaribacter sediminis TaxID=2865987 RepID=A0AAE3D0G1_9HYPH|nr:hypothetical protein [Flavimaribacter sediminis]MBW8636711.1 hypothetical protein [Flavimaribacter sediminis]